MFPEGGDQLLRLLGFPHSTVAGMMIYRTIGGKASQEHVLAVVETAGSTRQKSRPVIGSTVAKTWAKLWR